MTNVCTIIGRLTRDPELRRTQSDTPVCSFTLANDRDALENGERKTDFIDCVAWRKAAEIIAQYVQKGSMLAVTGRLQMRDWTDRDGNKRRNAEILVEKFQFCEPKKEKAEQDQQWGELSANDEGLPF